MSTWKIFALVMLSRSIWASTDTALFILGGEDAQEGEFPYMARILYRGEQFCGGTIIHSEWIVTAGQCTFKQRRQDISVEYGSVTVDSLIGLAVKKIFTYPDYDPLTYINDVGMLKIWPAIPDERMMQLSQAVNVGMLEKDAITLGWGRSGSNSPMVSTLQKLRVEIISDEECKEIIGHRFFKINICAKNDYPDGLTDVCHGDVGGPLIVGDEVIGINSWGPSSCSGGPNPMVFTRTETYVDWMDNIISDN